MSRKIIKNGTDSESIIFWDNFTISLYRDRVVDNVIGLLINAIRDGKNLTGSQSQLWLVCPEDCLWFNFIAADSILVIESNRTSLSFKLTPEDRRQFVSLLEEFLG